MVNSFSPLYHVAASWQPVAGSLEVCDLARVSQFAPLPRRKADFFVDEQPIRGRHFNWNGSCIAKFHTFY